VYHHDAEGDATSYHDHVLLCATLADGSTWALDPAGAQHGQYKPVLPFSDYVREYVVSEVARNPHGTAANLTHYYGPNTLQLCENWSYQNDELHAWIYQNGTVENLLKAEPSEYDRLKKLLVSNLAVAAHDYVNIANGYTVTWVRLPQKDHLRDFETLSKDNKRVVEIKRARINALKLEFRELSQTYPLKPGGQYVFVMPHGISPIDLGEDLLGKGSEARAAPRPPTPFIDEREITGNCAACARPANHRCVHCAKGVDIYGKTSQTLYCGQECQSKHWTAHETECKLAVDRRNLYRIGSLLQWSFYAGRKAAWHEDIGRVEKIEQASDDNKTKLLVEVKDSPGLVFPEFPESLFDEERDEQAVLAHEAPGVILVANLMIELMEGKHCCILLVKYVTDTFSL